MNNLRFLIGDDFFSKHKTEFMRELKALIMDPHSAHVAAQSFDNLEAIIKDSVGFNFSPQSPKEEHIALCISSVLVDGIYLFYTLYPKLRENCILLTRSMISKKYVFASMILERTETDFIKAVGVSGDVATFDKKYIRANTAYLYTQSKFNLLREESQGFTKLLVLLSENNIPSVDALWISPTSQSDGPSITIKEIRDTRRDLVKVSAEKVMDEILRVLDLILDIFAARIVNSYDFFIELLRISPWAKRSNPNLFSYMMGFKYTAYYGDHVKESSKPPLQMIFVTALLIKENLMTLGDIYPHLYPPDENINDDYDEYLKFCKDMGVKSARYQGPTLSGVLGDDSSKVIGVQEQKESVFDRINFKADLIECLLALGDLNNARKLLARFPNLSFMYQGIAEATCRLLHVIINPVYQPLEPLPSGKLNLDMYPPPLPTISFRYQERPCNGRKISNSKYSFFYHNWADNLVSVSDYSSAIKVLRVILVIIGGHLSKDINLVYKIIRIGKAHLQAAIDDPQVYNSWLNIISHHILPALSLTYSNPGLACELWSLLKLFPYTTRYGLYGEWKSILYKKIPEMSTALIGCEKDTKYIMARLSKETIKQYGRHIGKTVHSNPTVSFAYIIKQLESYDNMIVHVVDASRYLTELELDILTFSLIDALSDRRKKRIEENGTSFAPWLKSLANFCGTLFRRHAVDLGGVLRYIYNQLAVDNCYDLLVLQEIISSMSGIKIAEDVTNDQIDAIGAGETLRRESLMFESVRSSAKATKRLLDALIDSDLIVPIGILMAKIKRDIVFSAETHELKVIGWLHDHVKRTFLQYFDYLSSNLDLEKYSELFPSFKHIYCTTELDVGTIFHMLRPKLKFLISMYERNQTDKIDAMEIETSENFEQFPIHPALAEIAAEVYDSFSHENWKNISAEFFTTFWQLSLYDISVPEIRYQSEIDKLASLVSNLESDRTDMTSSGVSKRKREKERANNLIACLKQEMKVQGSNFSLVCKRLNSEKMTWFNNERFDSIALNFLQDFVYPRCMISPYDAAFCGKFIFLMHSIQVPRFSILNVLHYLFKPSMMQALIFSFTENESKNFGYFLSVVLRDLTLYHQDEGEFAKFKNNLIDMESLGDHIQFWNKMLNWEKQLRICFLNSLYSGEYMRIRNSILILDKINEFFPITKDSGTLIEAIIMRLEKTENRGDLKQLSRAYYGKLQLRKKSWIEHHEDTTVEVLVDKATVEDSSQSIVAAEDEPESGQINTDANSQTNEHELPSKLGKEITVNDNFMDSPQASAASPKVDNEGLVENGLNELEAQSREEGEQNDEEEPGVLREAVSAPKSILIEKEKDHDSREEFKSNVEITNIAQDEVTNNESTENLKTAPEEGETDPELGNVNHEFTLDNTKKSPDDRKVTESPSKPEEKEDLMEILRQAVKATMGSQDRANKSARADVRSNESPSKISRDKDFSAMEKNRFQSTKDYNSLRSRRDRDTHSQRDYSKEDRSHSGRNLQYSKEREFSRNSHFNPEREDGERGTKNNPDYSERNADRGYKSKNYISRENERASRYVSQNRERDSETRDGRDHDRYRSPERSQKSSWTNRQLSTGQRNFKDVITGTMLENMKKEKNADKPIKTNDGHRTDKDLQLKRDVYFPPNAKEESVSALKRKEDVHSETLKEELLKRSSFTYPKKDKEREVESSRASPDRNGDYERSRLSRSSRSSRSLERPSRTYDRKSYNAPARTSQRDIYTPPESRNNDPKSFNRNQEDYREKRSRQSSFEKEPRNNDRGFNRSDYRPRYSEEEYNRGSNEKSLYKKRSLEHDSQVSSAVSLESSSQIRMDDDKSHSKKVKINRLPRDLDK